MPKVLGFGMIFCCALGGPEYSAHEMAMSVCMCVFVCDVRDIVERDVLPEVTKWPAWFVHLCSIRQCQKKASKYTLSQASELYI